MFKKLNKMNVGKRLMTAFMIIILISSISGIMGAVSMKILDYQYGKALVENGFAQGQVNRLTGYLQRTAAKTRDVVFLTDQKEVEEAYAEIQQTAAKIDEGLEAVRVYCTTPKEKELFAEFDRILPLYREGRDKVLELGLENKHDEALRLFLTECSPYLQ